MTGVVFSRGGGLFERYFVWAKEAFLGKLLVVAKEKDNSPRSKKLPRKPTTLSKEGVFAALVLDCSSVYSTMAREEGISFQQCPRCRQKRKSLQKQAGRALSGGLLNLCPKEINGNLHSLFKGNFWFPSKNLPSPRNIRPSHLGVILWERGKLNS
jgi:hypothetical protein